MLLNASLGGLTFGKDGDGNYGYYGADGSLVPFKSGVSGLSIPLSMGRYGGAETYALFPTFDAKEMDYYVTTKGHFIIGLITSLPTQDEMRAFKFQGINTIRTSSLYGYTSVIDKNLAAGTSGSFDLSGYKGIYITNTLQGNYGDIVLTYQ